MRCQNRPLRTLYLRKAEQWTVSWSRKTGLYAVSRLDAMLRVGMKEIFDCAFCLAFGVEPRLNPSPPSPRWHVLREVFIFILLHSIANNICASGLMFTFCYWRGPETTIYQTMCFLLSSKAKRLLIRKRISKEPYTLTSQSSMRYPRLVSNRVCHTF